MGEIKFEDIKEYGCVQKSPTASGQAYLWEIVDDEDAKLIIRKDAWGSELGRWRIKKEKIPSIPSELLKGFIIGYLEAEFGPRPQEQLFL